MARPQYPWPTPPPHQQQHFVAGDWSQWHRAPTPQGVQAGNQVPGYVYATNGALVPATLSVDPSSADQANTTFNPSNIYYNYSDPQ